MQLAQIREEINGTTSNNAYPRFSCNYSFLAANSLNIIPVKPQETSLNSCQYASIPADATGDPVNASDPSGKYCSSDPYVMLCPPGSSGNNLPGPPTPCGGAFPSCPVSGISQPQSRYLEGSSNLDVIGNISGNLMVYVTSTVSLPEGMDIQFCPEYLSSDASSCQSSAFLEGNTAVFSLPSTSSIFPQSGSTSSEFHYEISASLGNPLDLLPPTNEEIPEIPQDPNYTDEPVDPQENEDTGFVTGTCGTSLHRSANSLTLLGDVTTPPDVPSYLISVGWFGTATSFSLG
ncbi:MAG: hypothetical protein HKL80_11365 [Acidimicrobiales bacterium]|nr:hypothetical protein [Acidimicrobiales bacterium]